MKIALVTGGNRGLGFETTRQLARNGFKVYFTSRSEEKGQEALDKFKADDLNVEFIKCDVTKTADIRVVHDRIKEAEGKLDVLVNNAGVFLESMNSGPEQNSIFKVNPVIILKTIETNTMGPLKLIQAVMELMHEEGRIINISSGMGALSDMEGLYPGYRMSKAALNALTVITAKELGLDSKISINSVCPGWCRTDMGGESATRSVQEGVETTMWLATCDNPPTGLFLRDKHAIDW